MAPRRGPGRPRNKVPTLQVRVLLPKPLKAQATKLAQARGVGLGTWFRQLAIDAIDRSVSS